MVRISWVTPLIPKDVKGFAELAAGIRAQTQPLDEFVLVSSGCSAEEVQILEEVLESLGCPYRHVARKKVHSIGSNKNLGVKTASGEWVSFIDADDIPHPRRNEFLQQAIRGVDPGEGAVVLHSFVRIPRDQEIEVNRLADLFPPLPGGPVNTFDELTNECAERVTRIVQRKAFFKVYSTLGFEGAESVPLHHAHTTTPRFVLLKNPFPLRGMRRDEDVVLLNKLFVRGFTLRFITAPLVLYREGWSDGTSGNAEVLIPFKRRLAIQRIYLRARKRARRFFRRTIRYFLATVGRG